MELASRAQMLKLSVQLCSTVKLVFISVASAIVFSVMIPAELGPRSWNAVTYNRSKGATSYQIINLICFINNSSQMIHMFHTLKIRLDTDVSNKQTLLTVTSIINIML